MKIPVAAWSLIGVVLGFSLGEGARWLRNRLRLRRLKVAIRSELRAALAQIEDKEDILRKAIKALQEKRVLPMVAVRSMTHGYSSYIHDLYDYYSNIERYCLHVIYERLRVADMSMETFHEDFQQAIKDKIVNDPWEYYVGYLEDIIKSYDLLRGLIGSFLAGEPEGVFHVEIRRAANEAIQPTS